MDITEKKAVMDPTGVSNRGIVPGFSSRFNFFLDQAGVEKANRFATGSRLFGVTLNTFRHWCINNKPPRHFIDLKEIVDYLLPNTTTLHNRDSVAIVAWLLCGEHVPNPFIHTSNGYLTDLVILITNVANDAGIALSKFKQVDRDGIILSVDNYIKKEHGKAPSRKLLVNNRELEKVIEQVLNLTQLGIL